MNDGLRTIERTVLTDYKYGFVSDIEADAAPKGLNEDIVRFISAKKNEPEWMLEWELSLLDLVHPKEWRRQDWKWALN